MLDSFSAFLAFGMPGAAEWIIIAAFGLLIFGKRLPEVGRSLGKGIVEFKKGLKGIEDDVEEQSNKPAKKLPSSSFRDGDSEKAKDSEKEEVNS